MSLEYFEEHMSPVDSQEREFQNIKKSAEFEILDQCDDEDCCDIPFSPSSFENPDDFEEIDEIEKKNEELALWKSKREEKEREEIEKTLEEELLENPPPDPFEEDILHTPEWHQAGDFIEDPLKKEAENVEKEPSYHPVINSGGALSWSDWAFTGNSFTPIPQKIGDVHPLEDNKSDFTEEELTDEPIFLEEPV